MKILIAEDDSVSRRLLQKLLSPYGDCDVVINGNEAIENFFSAHREGEPYQLVCLDIMMPEIDGQQVLRKLRDYEASIGIVGRDGAKIMMTTALDDPKNLMNAYKGGCEAYIKKPFSYVELVTKLEQLGFKQKEK